MPHTGPAGLMYTETLILEGHIIDSLLLPKVLDEILASGGRFELEEVRIGALRHETSYARVRVWADTKKELAQILRRVAVHGAQPLETQDAVTESAPADGVFPDEFYVTTNLETHIRLGGEWLLVEDIEMDCGIVVDLQARAARAVPMHRVRQGELVVVGRHGVRVTPLARQERGELFQFMRSEVSPEKSAGPLVANLAKLLRQLKAAGGKVLFVGGPAIVHTGARAFLVALMRAGYVDFLFAGNALAVHDIECELYGTSLGVDVNRNEPARDGHRNHLRAINTIRRLGGIRAAVEAGLLRGGIMHACVTQGIPFVLAGSIRDDGPLPEVVTDVMHAQERMRTLARQADLALMVATTLHSIAVGNLLPATTQIFCVDVNPAVVTKLCDRGSFQAVGMVGDARSFLGELCRALEISLEGTDGQAKATPTALAGAEKRDH